MAELGLKFSSTYLQRNCDDINKRAGDSGHQMADDKPKTSIHLLCM